MQTPRDFWFAGCEERRAKVALAEARLLGISFASESGDT
ncbi:MAG: hypothetical protein RLZZ214_4001 [Verrucomicrobiota bacterium]